jgi:hypothetical protein
MTEPERSLPLSNAPCEAAALLDRVAAAINEIEQAKKERSAEEMRVARTQLAALHGVARLRRQSETSPRAA